MFRFALKFSACSKSCLESLLGEFVLCWRELAHFGEDLFQGFWIVITKTEEISIVTEENGKPVNRGIPTGVGKADRGLEVGFPVGQGGSFEAQGKSGSEAIFERANGGAGRRGCEAVGGERGPKVFANLKSKSVQGRQESTFRALGDGLKELKWVSRLQCREDRRSHFAARNEIAFRDAFR